MSDYYKTLGIEKGANEAAIKKAYRKLAMKYHPDRNKGDKKAEDQFKKVNEAYAVLSDDKKRKQYDTFGDQKFHQQYSQEDIFRGTDFSSIFQEMGFGGAAGGAGADIFSQLFGGMGGGGGGFRGRSAGATRQQAPAKGQDIEYPLTISFDDAFHGEKRQIQFSLTDGTHRELSVTIPAGVKSGTKLRLKGRGATSPYGGENGDLFVIVNVGGHPQYTRVDNDIHVHYEIKLSEALQGASIEVQTYDGKKRLKVPQLVKPGTKIRLKGLGFPDGASRGDFYVIVDFKIPSQLTADQLEVVTKMENVGL